MSGGHNNHIESVKPITKYKKKASNVQTTILTHSRLEDFEHIILARNKSSKSNIRDFPAKTHVVENNEITGNRPKYCILENTIPQTVGHCKDSVGHNYKWQTNQPGIETKTDAGVGADHVVNDNRPALSPPLF